MTAELEEALKNCVGAEELDHVVRALLAPLMLVKLHASDTHQTLSANGHVLFAPSASIGNEFLI